MRHILRILRLAGAALLLGLAGQTVPAAAQNNADNAKAGVKAVSTGRTPIQSTGTQLATSELVRIEQEVQLLNQRLSQLSLDEQAAQRIDDVLKRVTAIRPDADNICAAAAEDERRIAYENQVTGLVQEAGSLAPDNPGPWNAWPNPEGFCSPADFPAAVLDEISGQLTGARPTLVDRETLEEQLEELNERRDEVLRDMSDRIASTSVARQIPLLLILIFGIGAGTLAGVKLFRDEVQSELIASGQIVQFVTILILLGVILSLGLAQRLQAETLGTLLGGLAGYVLSQGVGRQAKQQVLNEMKSVTGTGPSPPPPPPPPAPPPPAPPPPPPPPPPP